MMQNWRQAVADADYNVQMRRLEKAEGGGWLAEVADLPGCMSDGATPDEALRNVRNAIGEWIDCAIELGRHVPAPSQHQIHA